VSATSTWTWTLVVPAGRAEKTITGKTIAPAGATEDSILPGILDDLRSDHLRGIRFRRVRFSATRIR
jgi:hypothetical protein